MNMASDTETAAMDVVRLPLALIDRSGRLRPVSRPLAHTIAESMKERGQMTPILVRSAREDGIYKLIAGEHRCEACVINQEEFILAVIHDVSDDEARMMEIDENLAHADLNAWDKAKFLGERKKVWERLYPQTAHGKAKKINKAEKVANSATILRFTLGAAQLAKVSERTIQALVFRYDSIDSAVGERISGTWLADVGAHLDAIARLPKHEQMAVVEAMVRPEDPQPNIVAALVEVRGIQQKPRRSAEDECEKLKAIWRKTGTPGRQLFRQFLETPESRKAPETKAAAKSKKAGA